MLPGLPPERLGMESAWCIYYDDPELDFGSWDGPPELAPKRGVQCIAMASSVSGRELVAAHPSPLSGKDFYWWTGERWFGGDLFGLYDALLNGWGIVTFGRYVTSDVYQAAIRRAQTDERLPRKSAYSESEGHIYPNGLNP